MGIFVLKNGDVFLNNRKKIFILDYNNSKAFELTRMNYQFDNSLVIIEKKNYNIFICNSKNKIKFFHISIKNTISEDLASIIVVWIFFILFVKIILYKSQINSYKKKCFILSCISLWIFKNLIQYRFFKDKIKYFLIPFESSI